MKDMIELRGMRFFAYHGCFESERKNGNYFDVTLRCFADLSAAAESDSLEDTIDYSQLFDIVKHEMAIPSDLLENVAGRIASRVKRECLEVKEGSVTISKNNPPFDASALEGVMVENVGAAAVTINF